MRCLRIADGLNTITLRGEIGTSFPVLGLRPIRCPFLRTTNEPKDDSFTVSPRSRQSVISFSTSSTSAADSVRDNPTRWYTASHKSARVTVFAAIASPAFGDRYISLNFKTILGCRSRVNGAVAGRPRQDVGSCLKRRRSPTRSAGFTGCSPAQQYRSPGEAASHRLQHDQVAVLDAPVDDRR